MKGLGMDFLALLRDDLRAGLASHPDPARLATHGQWILKQQGPGGGFKNRRGREDLYYTTFAVRSLSALNALTTAVASRTKGYLLAQSERPDATFGNAVHAVSWWDAYRLCAEASGDESKRPLIEACKQQTLDRLTRLRCSDGGWAKTQTEKDGSLYHTFLATCTYQRMDHPLPEDARPKMEAFLKERTAPGGGFLESRYSKTPGVNGSAAGISLAVLLKAMNLKLGERALTSLKNMPDFLRRAFTGDLSLHASFLKHMQNEEGGFQASANAPFADLLSTYTGLFSLELLGQRTPETTAKALAFAEEMEVPKGGYVGFALEQNADCEYTFYGIGVERMRAE